MSSEIIENNSDQAVNPAITEIMTQKLVINETVDANDNNDSTKNRVQLRKLLNHVMKVKITDGRVVIGVFLCTDKHSNIILSSCHEFSDLEGMILIILKKYLRLSRF